ncbi:MAG TPA: low affinity iron permease family protein [Bacteroidia bacterium]|jgi:low affinity Fe/Cu permease|nr:low affinity iron permease family protein [Bacteroidia bacterium]
MSKTSDSPNVSGFSRGYNKIAAKITQATGSPFSSIAAILIIIGWLVCGPVFGFSDTWQLVINTGTTIITFIMVFIIQQSQNKDTSAIQLKLNELIACDERASNRLVSIEELTDEELRVLKKFYSHLALLSKEGKDLHSSHSLDEAKDNAQQKIERHRTKLKKRS